MLPLSHCSVRWTHRTVTQGSVSNFSDLTVIFISNMPLTHLMINNQYKKLQITLHLNAGKINDCIVTIIYLYASAIDMVNVKSKTIRGNRRLYKKTMRRIRSQGYKFHIFLACLNTICNDLDLNQPQIYKKKESKINYPRIVNSTVFILHI